MTRTQAGIAGRGKREGGTIRLGYPVSCIGLVAVFFFGSHVAYGQNPPIPNLNTAANYYVSLDGDDANPGSFAKPFRTPTHALDVLGGLPDPSGKVVLIRGGVYRLRDDDGNRLYFKDLHGKLEAPIQVRGYPGEIVVLDAFLKKFNPLAVPFDMECGWGGIAFLNSSHIVVENFTVRGRCISNVEILDSNYITVRFINSYRSDKHGLFTGGSFHDLVIEGCSFFDQMYGSLASHGVYISGGHWDPNLPPVRNVWIRYVECFHNHRHGIQFNGRIENVVVDHCSLHHNVLGGLSLIGVRNASVHHNVIYKNNKQPIILYTYFDTAYWDPNDPESVALWKATHWTIENVQIHHNTLYMDKVPWYKDQWVQYNPTYHSAIHLVDTTGLLPPFKNIVINNNILFNHSDMLVQFENIGHVVGTYSFFNLFYSPPYPESVSCFGLYPIPWVESCVPYLWCLNLTGYSPCFNHVTPTQVIDGTDLAIDFMDPSLMQFNDDFNVSEGSPAHWIHAGAFED